MSDSDDSDCGPPKKVGSGTQFTGWDIVPENTDFIFKIKLDGTKWTKLAYTLKKGVTLPYNPVIEGVEFKFTNHLEPEVAGQVGKKEKGYWKFEAHKETVGEGDNLILGPRIDSNGRDGTEKNLHEQEKNDANNSSSEEEIDKAILKLNGSGIMQFGCAFCSFKSEMIHGSRVHISLDHPKWEDDLKTLDDLRTLAAPVNSSKAPPASSSPHTNPNWLKDLTSNFLAVVVDKCSTRVKQAIETNEVIEDLSEHKLVWNEILNTTVVHLMDIFGEISVPRKQDMREVGATLCALYPRMFRESNPTSASGFEPSKKVLSLNDLASNIIDRFRSKTKKKRPIKTEGDGEPVQEKLARLGKPKIIYGVDNKKFHGKKPSVEAIASLSKTSNEKEFDKREAVFSQLRPEIQEQLSNAQNRIIRISKGFWESPLHLAGQFEYLTGTKNLTETASQNLGTQIGYLERYLMHFDKTFDFKDRIADVEELCETKYQGSLLYKYIMILRFAGTFLDKDGAVLLRLDSDGPATITGPYISAKEINKTFIFSLHVEQDELLGALELAEAVAAFLHLCFVCDLKYPKEASTLADILQRQVAKYGDETGSRCFGTKGKAQTKFSSFMAGLGKVLAQ